MAAEITASRRRATGRTLLIISALGAAGFAGWSLAQLQLTTSETFLSEAWHAFGLIVFAGLFALVAWRPQAYPGLMELTIVHSIGMFVLALTNQDAAGATATMILHGLLALALLVAYVVLGCIKAWRRAPAAQRPASAPASAPAKRPEDARGPVASGSSPAKGQQDRGKAAESGPRGLDRGSEPTAKPGAAPQGRTGTAATRPMPQEFPEDHPQR
ncbi:hypothetical protein I2485_10905 [Nesterenkonia sp. E16_7]|uniref:hypothetical protein n=1 Tax=unclassified Nesterenkonia TaxID=2629769 RepID=UPI001A935DC9|nr:MULTISPECIES: hypothetical protein [unclassified Nesterenkonia]MBO0595399.1 hypothetical protein [Nesterenkonia sp. E16_10]MBO0599153.1 hypothetical protein [Nesterenkonia sp. E16_7]